VVYFFFSDTVYIGNAVYVISLISMLMYAGCYIIMANTSISLSFNHTLVLYLNECIYCETLSTMWKLNIT